MEWVVLDPGLSLTKACRASAPEDACVFPSTVVEVTSETDLCLSEAPTVEVEGRRYLVGVSGFEEYGRGLFAETDKIARLLPLLAEACRRIPVNEDEIGVMVCLPGDVRRVAADVRARLAGVREIAGRLVRVREVRLTPEGIGAYFDLVLVERRRRIEVEKEVFSAPLCIVDVGSRTTDTCVVHRGRLVASAVYDLGVETVARRLFEALSLRNPAAYGLLRQAVCEGASEVLISGVPYSLRDLPAVRARVAREIVRAVLPFGAEAGASFFVVVGGGALFFRDDLLREAREIGLAELRFADSPIFSNVRGMAKYLRHTAAPND